MSSDTIHQKLLTRLKISPLTRAQLADLLYLDIRSVDGGVRALQRNGLIKAVAGSRRGLPACYAPTAKGEVHQGPIRYQLSSKKVAVAAVRSSIYEEGGIVATALRRSPTFVFQLGACHA